MSDYSGSVSTSTTGIIDAINDIEPDCIGASPQYVVYATPDNYSAAIAADGDPAVIVEGGWLYKNPGGASKINWYVYANDQNQAATAKKVSDIQNIYMVINQQTPLTAVSRNPFIAFYTLRDAGTNTSWYKNRYVFVNDRESAEVVGPKLLYTGVDNPLIHPEITTRVQLLFNAETSTANLEQGANELVWLSSIQTSSGTLANEYNFVLSEFGHYYTIEGLKRVRLPIINNRVQCELLTLPAISGSVAVSNLPTVQHTVVDSGSVAVSNLGDIETKLTEISAQTLAISNLPKYPSFTSAFLTVPEELTAGSSVLGSEFSMTNILDGVVYKNVMFMGYVDVSVNTDPQLILFYSDDQLFWYSDGVQASFYKPTPTYWHFSFQRSQLGAKYVKLGVKNTTTLERCSVNLSV